MNKETAPFKRKAQSLIKQINRDLSNMKLTSNEVLKYSNPNVHPKKLAKPDPFLSEEQRKKREPNTSNTVSSMFSDAKILLRRGLRKLKGKPSSSELVKQRTTLLNHLEKIKEFEKSK